MDRQSGAEAAGHHTDEQLRQALTLIIRSYEGVQPEQLFRDAIRCFDSLIEISQSTEAITDFALRNSIDLKYLVDGANFVISKLHFNSNGNYYHTLGLPQSASSEDIHLRWKRLMLLYHPDRQLTEEAWVSERAKKVNEAYSVLKDDARRAAFDRKLAEEAMAASHQHHAPGPAAASGQRHGRRGRRRSPSSTSFSDLPPSWSRFRRLLPKIMIGVYVVIALTVLFFIYQQNQPSTLESELTAAQQHRQASTLPLSEPPLSGESSVPAEEIPPAAPAGEPGSVEAPHAGLTPPRQSAAAQNVTKVAPPEQPPVPSPDSASLKTVKASPLPKQITPPPQEKETAVAQNAAKVAPSEMRRGPSLDPESRKTASVSSELKPVTTLPQEKKPAAQDTDPQPAVVQATPSLENRPREVRAAAQPVSPHPASLPASSPAPEITQADVRVFMDRYVRAYRSNDLETFMSFFSEDAVENNSLRYRDIRKAYAITFEEKINYYQISNMAVVIKGPNAFVSGTYTLSRYDSRETRWMKFEGRITWKLKSEQDRLLITSVNYDR